MRTFCDPLEMLDSTGAKEFVVGFSGGKDSSAVLSLVNRFGKAHVYFMYLVPNLEYCEIYLRWAERKYKQEVIRVPHWWMTRVKRFGIYCDPQPKVKLLKFRDVENYIKNKTGVEWAAHGHRIGDSIHRMAMLKKLKGIEHDAKRVYPIWNWTPQMVTNYLSRNGIPWQKPPYKGAKSFGINFDYRFLVWIKDHYPEDYRKILEEFPYAEAEVRRKQAREVRDQIASEIKDKKRALQS